MIGTVRRKRNLSGTPRTKGGTRIISADGTERIEPANYKGARAVVTKAEHRKYAPRPRRDSG